MKKLLMIMTICIAQLSFAGPANHCISIGANDRAQTITNTCNYKVFVAWCHNRDERGYRGGLCRADGKFYQKGWVLDAGESRSNKYTVPLDSTISYGVCKGGWNVFSQKGLMNGDFYCED